MNTEVLKKIGIAMLVAGVTAAAQEGLKHLTNIKIDVSLQTE